MAADPERESLAADPEWTRVAGNPGWARVAADPEWANLAAGPERGEWLQIPNGQWWLQTQGGREWLQTPTGRDGCRPQLGKTGGRLLQRLHGQQWKISQIHWKQSAAVQELAGFLDVPGIGIKGPGPGSFQLCITTGSLSTVHGDHPCYDSLCERRKTNTKKESRSASDALKYACQNWAVHLSRAPNPWNNSLNHVFKTFWNHHLLSWLKRQWCLKGLRSCLLVLSEMQKFAKPRPIKPTLRHSPSTPPAPLPKPNTTVSDAGTSRKRKQGEPRIDHDSPPLTDNESVNPIPSNRPKRDRQSLRPRGGESKRASKQCKKKK
ncbi:hypothetical protein DFH29DRAFT_1005844 [Suillus ampliporus]|nr:hypothetical protein DFH29DRAFT_1005844 [Suillus ampliporus]